MVAELSEPFRIGEGGMMSHDARIGLHTTTASRRTTQDLSPGTTEYPVVVSRSPDHILSLFQAPYICLGYRDGSGSVSVVVPDVGTTALPETITDALVEDCDYYKVENINIKELTNKDFIEAFVKKDRVAMHQENQESTGIVICVWKKQVHRGCRGSEFLLQIRVTGCVLKKGLNIIWALGSKQCSPLFFISRLTVLSENTSIDLDDCAALTPCGHLVLSLSRETYQKLGIEGKPSFFCAKSASRYGLRNLYRMIGLEVLDLGSGSGGWNTSDIEKLIVSGVSSMKNLTSLCLCFDCTDHILSVVGQNCTRLQKLDVTASRSVTDRSVNALLNCPQLSELRLNRTSISIDGFATLLMGLRRLEDFGRCDEFGCVLEHILEFHKSVGPFGLRMFQSRDVTSCQLNLLIKMCPFVMHVYIYHDERISDLTILSALENLSELKLLSCDFFTDNVKTLLELKGYNITWLHLEHVEEIDMNALVHISQFCPNIKKLVFYNCDFLEHTSISMKKLAVPPFQHLEHIISIANGERTDEMWLLGVDLKHQGRLVSGYKLVGMLPSHWILVSSDSATSCGQNLKSALLEGGNTYSSSYIRCSPIAFCVDTSLRTGPALGNLGPPANWRMGTFECGAQAHGPSPL
uniref:Uncharacterized protein n=1 Tax=Timema bartmani TaxID=61472 RepID=A0A7R9F497_9NEOP|nr:unnamed protein product [Timema bartmani]